jgi:sugar phosphate isomerase/epimerase
VNIVPNEKLIFNILPRKEHYKMKLCVQTGDVVDRLGIKKGYAAIREAGFEAIDWNLDHAWNGSDIRDRTYRGKCIFEKSSDEIISHYARELEEIQNNSLEISQAHAPFPAYSKGDPDFLDYAIEVFKGNIKYCDYAGCKNLVIHGIPFAMDGSLGTREDVHNMNVKLYSSLIPVLKETSVTVCLENLFINHRGVRYQGNCGYPEEAVKYIDMFNDMAGREAFGLCLDTGHLNLLHHDFEVYVPIVGKRIKCLHVHDNNGTSDQHMAPCTGTIDWNRFCNSLRGIGYDADLSFETFAQTNCACDFDERAVLPWLRMIKETGEIMREKILG